MHGTGNDYIYVYAEDFPLEHPGELSVAWSAPHTGIGADGLVLIEKSLLADFRMRIFNADGSEARMCGNASRCIGKYVYENKLTDKTQLTLETLSGIKTLQLTLRGQIVEEVTVDMGVPTLKHRALSLEVEPGISLTGTVVDVGNPHFVVFVDDLREVDLPREGPRLENHAAFPGRINVEFVQVINPGEMQMRVWERGSGITRACGTGACATLVAAVALGKTRSEAQVHMDGGTLTLGWDAATNHIFMTGNAVRVFEGQIAL
jgi:diaminopimelate epimerase